MSHTDASFSFYQVLKKRDGLHTRNLSRLGEISRICGKRLKLEVVEGGVDGFVFVMRCSTSNLRRSRLGGKSGCQKWYLIPFRWLDVKRDQDGHFPTEQYFIP